MNVTFRSVFTGLLAIMCFQFGFAQSDTSFTIIGKTSYTIQLETGKRALRNHDYLKAIQTFRTLASKNPTDAKTQFWLAKTHFVFKNYGFGKQYLEKAMELDSTGISSEALFLTAQNEHHLGNLDKAIENYELCMQSFSKKELKDFDVQRYLEISKTALEISKQEKFAERQAISFGDINTGFDDYAPVLTEDGAYLYFTSRRSSTTGGMQNPYDGQYFEDIYVANWSREDNAWDSVTNQGFLQKVNKNGFESLSWIDPTQKLAYITLNNEAIGTGIKTKSSDIFEIYWTEDEEWSKPKKTKTSVLNSSSFDAGATITADGSTMYFASDRNLDKGSDIYMSKKVNDKWTTPVVLPENINTKGNETTPFITSDGQYLFFSSNEHAGMGDYDIFYSKNLGNNKWSNPINVGPSVNSTNDDTHFQYYPTLKKAFFASRVNKNMKSDMDIFEIDMSNFKFVE